MSRICSSCGAKLADDAVRCDLCGTEVGDVETPDTPARPESAGASDDAPSADPAPSPVDAASTGPLTDAVFCNQCGWKNPPGARFCSACGAPLQHVHAAPAVPASSGAVKAVKAAPPPPKSGGGSAKAEQTVGKRMGMILGAAVLVVLAFFLIDAASKGGGSGNPVPPTGTSPSAPAAQVSTDTPLPDDVAGPFEAAVSDADALEGDARVARLREAVRIVFDAGRFDRAAEQQERIAELTGTEDDWALAGNYYYDWMDQQFGEERATFAKKAIAAYRKALEINPDNLDVRTDMAVAYMSDPDNPMLAIQENNAVLEKDSLHVQANFNRGIMLLQINRTDQALEQFRKVQRIVGDPEAPIYQLAEQAIQSIEGGNPGALN